MSEKVLLLVLVDFAVLSVLRNVTELVPLDIPFPFGVGLAEGFEKNDATDFGPSFLAGLFFSCLTVISFERDLIGDLGSFLTCDAEPKKLFFAAFPLVVDVVA